MSKAAMGARIMYCGHDGWFPGDIFKVAGANVVRAGGPVNGSMLIRGLNEQATHLLIDTPEAGFWRPDLGVFVVPVKQVKRLESGCHCHLRRTRLPCGREPWAGN